MMIKFRCWKKKKIGNRTRPISSLAVFYAKINSGRRDRSRDALKMLKTRATEKVKREEVIIIYLIEIPLITREACIRPAGIL